MPPKNTRNQLVLSSMFCNTKSPLCVNHDGVVSTSAGERQRWRAHRLISAPFRGLVFFSFQSGTEATWRIRLKEQALRDASIFRATRCVPYSLVCGYAVSILLSAGKGWVGRGATGQEVDQQGCVVSGLPKRARVPSFFMLLIFPFVCLSLEPCQEEAHSARCLVSRRL